MSFCPYSKIFEYNMWCSLIIHKQCYNTSEKKWKRCPYFKEEAEKMKMNTWLKELKEQKERKQNKMRLQRKRHRRNVTLRKLNNIEKSDPMNLSCKDCTCFFWNETHTVGECRDVLDTKINPQHKICEYFNEKITETEEIEESDEVVE